MRCICSAVISEGETDEIGVIHRASTAGAGVTTDTENESFALIGIRLQAAHVGTDVEIIEADIQIHTASEYAEWELVFNPTVADTFTYSNISNSKCQRALGGTLNSVTAGTVIAGGYIETGSPGKGGGGSADSAIHNALRLGVAIDGTTLDTIVLAIRPIGGVSALTAEGSLTWRESI